MSTQSRNYRQKDAQIIDVETQRCGGLRIRDCFSLVLIRKAVILTQRRQDAKFFKKEIGWLQMRKIEKSST